jgi:hypothetical protein
MGKFANKKLRPFVSKKYHRNQGYRGGITPVPVGAVEDEYFTLEVLTEEEIEMLSHIQYLATAADNSGYTKPKGDA